MITRALDLEKLLKYSQSAFLFGPRGTGKSVLSEQYVRQARASFTVDLLRSGDYLRYLAEPWRLSEEIDYRIGDLDGGSMVVLIDEVQKIPILLDEVHSCIERFPERISFLLTGSSARKLKRQQANLLAGRARRLHLHPLSAMETEIRLTEALSYGTLPVLRRANSDAPEFLHAYVETYLKEEILQEALVRRADVFSRFLELAAQMNGEPINFSKIARNCKVSAKTAQEYFQILEDTLLVTRLDGWSESVQKQLLQAPKYYFFDCGVLNALTGEIHSQLRPSSFRYGRLFETWVIQELQRASDYYSLHLRFNYWRTSSQQEVDCVISRTYHRPLAAIEIKSSQTPAAEDLTGLRTFAQDYDDVPLYCLCTTPRAYQIDKIKVLPWQEGARTIRDL